jgi:hypothetical protein
MNNKVGINGDINNGIFYIFISSPSREDNSVGK